MLYGVVMLGKLTISLPNKCQKTLRTLTFNEGSKVLNVTNGFMMNW